jgi:threonine synthase
MVCLATAHPAKFADAIDKAAERFSEAGLEQVALPAHMADLFEREERMTVLPDDIAAVQSFIAENV